MKTLFLASGIPASGKSTWCKARLMDAEPETAIWHSRDEIRFALLKDGDNYFAYEDDVVKLWIKAIQASINDPFITEIYVDATHLNDRAREKTLRQLILTPDVEIVNVAFDTPLEACLQRNSQRTGRARVPDNIIRRMFKNFHMPNNNYKTIVIEGG